MLYEYCGSRHIQKYFHIQPSVGAHRLNFTEQDYESIGVKTVVAWMEEAYNACKCEKCSIVPRKLDQDLFTLCCAERALKVFGLDQEREYVRRHIEHNQFNQTMSVNLLKPIWDHLPRDSPWVEMTLDKVQSGVVFMHEHLDRTGYCYCGFSPLASAEHVNCIEAWLAIDGALREAVGPFYNSRGTHLYSKLGIDCNFFEANSIEQWILDVSDKHPYPLGEFPARNVLLSERRPSIPTQTSSAPIKGNYQLSLSKQRGLCYYETWNYGAQSRSSVSTHKDSPVSSEWLASRGYRGGSSSPGPEIETHMPFDRTEDLRNAGINHICPEWLAHDVHWVCAFREGPILGPQPQSPGLETLLRDPELFPKIDVTWL